MTLVALVVAVLLAAWGAAELRRREAERQRDVLRGQILGFLAAALTHAEEGGNSFDRAASMLPPQAWLEPMFEEAQFGASRMRALERTMREAIRALGRRRDDGREREQENRV